MSGVSVRRPRAAANPAPARRDSPGRRAMRRFLRLRLAVFGARVLIFAGVAGGLNPAFPVGSVLLGERLALEVYGAISARGFPPTA